MEKVANNKIISVEVITGVEGPSLYINGYRIVGEKPWGGGLIKFSWKISAGKLRHYLCEAGIGKSIMAEEKARS